MALYFDCRINKNALHQTVSILPTGLNRCSMVWAFNF